jgi:hypothetical protein
MLFCVTPVVIYKLNKEKRRNQSTTSLQCLIIYLATWFDFSWKPSPVKPDDGKRYNKLCKGELSLSTALI